MAEDWAADVLKYVPGADPGVIAKIVNYCGIALHNRDSSLVSFSDKTETDRVRENFLKKKLQLEHPDDVLDGAIKAVGERMKEDRTKNRVTVYYLLAEHFGMLPVFGGGASSAGGTAAAAGAAAAGVASLAALDGGAAKETANDVADDASTLAGTAAAAAVPAAAMAAPVRDTPEPPPQALSGYGDTGAGDDRGGGIPWWVWAALAALLVGLLWWWLNRQRGDSDDAAGSQVVAEGSASASSDAGAGATDAAAAGATATAAASATDTGAATAIPAGAGVTSGTRDGKPLVTVYFDTGKAAVAPGFAAAAGGLKDYLTSHAGTSLAVSGFNDKTGNAAANAELSKNRAKAVKAALVAAGIPDASVEMVKPSDSTDTSTDNAGARRVEVVVRP